MLASSGEESSRIHDCNNAVRFQAGLRDAEMGLENF